MLKELFIKNAKSLGISEIGFTPISSLDEEYSRFREWIGKGFHGDMEWLERNGDKRHSPSRLVEWEEGTAIVCLFSYNTGRYHYSDQHSDNKGKIAQYAWGRDYHDVVPRILRNLVNKVSENFNELIQYRAFCDTGPLLERDLAVRAGVGWRGKNSLILNKKHGSYLFIGVLLIDKIIESDSPVFDRCGSCTACIDNCPTNAIVEPYKVDSRKCISYLTIENPEVAPSEDHDRHGWLYGCDICQQVCPYNNIRNPLSPYETFYQLNFGMTIEPQKVLNMDKKQYNKRKTKSAIKRAGLNGLKLNAEKLL